ncbi:MAG: hypothetical protein HY718_18680, partial [Planctomycetes bacterium]|nr:hypothetical protein [Planctomycetota bacterium]
LDLLDAIEAGTTLTTIRVFGGLFIDGISYDGHGNSGFGGGEDWWHYWTRDADSPWTSPFFGAGDRVAQDGSADGWIYGRDGAPLPEPATAVLGLAGAALLAIPRSRRAARR